MTEYSVQFETEIYNGELTIRGKCGDAELSTFQFRHGDSVDRHIVTYYRMCGNERHSLKTKRTNRGITATWTVSIMTDVEKDSDTDMFVYTQTEEFIW